MKTQPYFAIFSLPTHASGKRTTRAHSSDLLLRPCGVACSYVEKSATRSDCRKPVMNLHHTHRKIRVALFIEYLAYFLIFVWRRIVSCMSAHFREGNCIAATSGGDAVRNRKVIWLHSHIRKMATLLAFFASKMRKRYFLPNGVPHLT